MLSPILMISIILVNINHVKMETRQDNIGEHSFMNQMETIFKWFELTEMESRVCTIFSIGFVRNKNIYVNGTPDFVTLVNIIIN